MLEILKKFYLFLSGKIRFPLFRKILKLKIDVKMNDLDWNYKIIKLFNQLIIRLLNQCHNIKILKKHKNANNQKKSFFTIYFLNVQFYFGKFERKVIEGVKRRWRMRVKERNDEKGTIEKSEYRVASSQLKIIIY